MRETSKATKRRKGDGFYDRVFQGFGVDIGSGNDPLIWEGAVVETFDLDNGDAQFITEYRKSGVYDFVHSSNCLEHMEDPVGAVVQWFSLLKPGGHLIFTVPDEDLYEQGVFPSRWNADHKYTFSIFKHASWSRKSVNVFSLFRRLVNFEVLRVIRVDTDYDYSLRGVDQTMEPYKAEAFIEVVIRKTTFAKSSVLSFKHSGARGDIIYSLPTIAALGGGVLYLNLSDKHYLGKSIECGDDFRSFAEFLKVQSYVKDVIQWNGEVVDYDLDLFRELNVDRNLLSQSHLDRFGAEFDLTGFWIDGVEGKFVADIVINRSQRYHGSLEWGQLKGREKRCVFVGFEEEWNEFVKETGLEVSFYKVESYLDLASVIAGSKLFVGNQSFCYSLAEAMKHPRVLEVCDECPNCQPQSSNGWIWLCSDLLWDYVDGENNMRSTVEQRKTHQGDRFVKLGELKVVKNPYEYRPTSRPLMSVVRSKYEIPVGDFEIVDDVESATGDFVCLMFGEVGNICSKQILLPFSKEKVGVVIGGDAVVFRRKMLEHVGGVKTLHEVAGKAVSNGYSVVFSSGLR